MWGCMLPGNMCLEMCAGKCVHENVCLIMALYLRHSLSSNTSAMSLMKTTHQQLFSSKTLLMCYCLMSVANTSVLPSLKSIEVGDVVHETAAGLCGQTLEMTYVNGDNIADGHQNNMRLRSHLTTHQQCVPASSPS